MATFGLIYLIFYGSTVLIKNLFKLPNKAPREGASDETLEALDILLGVSFEKLPLFINHKNPIIQEFVQMKLKTGTVKNIL